MEIVTVIRERENKNKEEFKIGDYIILDLGTKIEEGEIINLTSEYVYLKKEEEIIKIYLYDIAGIK